MADNNIKVRISVDVRAAVRDPLFWFGLLLSKLTFGRVDTARWRKYLKVEDVNA